MTFTMFCVLLLMSYGGVGVLQESARRRCRPVRLRPGSEDSSRPWPSADVLAARLSLDVVMGAVPPLVYAIPLLLWAAESLTHAAVAAAAFMMAESALTFFRTGGHALRMRYAALRVLVQIPVQVWALFTVYDQAWMTRDPGRPSAR